MVRVCLMLTWAFVAVGVVFGEEPKPADGVEDVSREIKEPKLAAELHERFLSDQAARQEMVEFTIKHKLNGIVEFSKIDPKIVADYMALVEKLQGEDRKNLKWLKEVVAKYGWPCKSLVGSASAHEAWLLVQHADSEREFQKSCLSKMEALPKGEVDPRDIAYLTDRILVGTGKKQKYGTQATLKDGKVVPQPIEDEEHVDERRQALGMESLKAYLKSMEEVYLGPRKPGPL